MKRGKKISECEVSICLFIVMNDRFFLLLSFSFRQRIKQNIEINNHFKQNKKEEEEENESKKNVLNDFILLYVKTKVKQFPHYFIDKLNLK